jgi:hypothetical protein
MAPEGVEKTSVDVLPVVVFVVTVELLRCAVGDDERTASPMPTPAPRAARTRMTMPIRTTVLFRRVITGGSSSAAIVVSR